MHAKPSTPVARVFNPCILSLFIATLSLAQTQPTSQPTQVTVLASVEPFWSADLHPRAAGYLSEIKADLGDRVKKGQLLATIDAPELQRDLAAAEATLIARQQSATAAQSAIKQSESAVEVAKQQLAVARADADLAQSTLKRQDQLFQTKAITDQQLDESKSKSAVATAQVQVAQARIAAAESDLLAARAQHAVAQAQVQVALADVEKSKTLLSYTQITAPFDGIITRRSATPGDLVPSATPARTPLFTLQQTDPVRVFCDVPEQSTRGITPGSPATISLPSQPGAAPLPATVTRTADTLDPRTRTMRIEIDLPNPDGRLKPGAYASVSITPGGSK